MQLNIKDQRPVGALQNQGIFFKKGVVIVDQDGNRYPNARVKLAFLKQCLAEGIRAGTLKPITTANQCRDLIARINLTALGLHSPAETIDQAEADKIIAQYAQGSPAQPNNA